MRPIIEFCQDLVNGWRAARRQRAMIKQAQANEARLKQLKGRIIAIGELPMPDGGVWLGEGWSFHLPPGLPLVWVDMQGIMHFAGYTTDELREIHAHRADWVS